jgi:hypothetical protein
MAETFGGKQLNKHKTTLLYKMKQTIFAIVFALVGASCTENQMAKQFGGTMRVELPANTKFVNATWKNDELWYIYRNRRADESAETVTMQEDSNFGLVEGKVLFIEK